MEYNEPIPNKDYKVLVKCFTFNQSKYIEDALNGFTMQKTTFPFVCTIVDDCSTDGEQEIIKAYLDNEFLMSASEHFETEYANITIAQHKVNTNCTFAIYFLKYNHYSKKEPKAKYLKKWRECCEYEALCEGDDYWIDSHKLQKQVNWLDSNPDYKLTYAFSKVQNINGALRDGRNYSEIELSQLLVTGYVPTCTIVYQSAAFIQYLNEVNPSKKKWLQGDLPLILWFAAKHKIYCFEENFSVYRIVSGSASHSFSIEKVKRMRESELNVRLFFDKTYNNGRLTSDIYDWYNRIILQIALYQERAIKVAIDSFFKISHKRRKDYVLLLKGILSNIKYNLRNKQNV